MSQWHKDGISLVGQGRDHPIALRLNCSYLCSWHSRYSVTAIHTWQALKMHKETQCPLETHPSSFHYFIKFYYNNHFEEWAWWLQFRTYRVPFGPRETRNSRRTLRALQGRGRRQNRDSYHMYLGHIKEICTTSMLVVINADSTHSVSLGTYFSWRSSLSLITLHENKIVFMWAELTYW